MNVLWPRPCEQWLQKPANARKAEILQMEPACGPASWDHTLMNLNWSDANEQH